LIRPFAKFISSLSCNKYQKNVLSYIIRINEAYRISIVVGLSNEVDITALGLPERFFEEYKQLILISDSNTLDSLLIRLGKVGKELNSASLQHS
jgi:hypothetical protein